MRKDIMPKKGKAKECVSIPIEGSLILLSEIQKGGAFLFLYGQNVEKYNSYRSFLEHGLKNNEICLYAFEDVDQKWHPEMIFKEYIENERLHVFPIDNLEALDTKISKTSTTAKSRGESLRLLVDFCNIANPENINTIVSSGEKILKRGKDIPITSITAFNVNSMDYETVGKIMKMYEKVIFLSQTGELFAALPTFATVKTFKKPSLVAISQQTTEALVKNNLETLTLYLLHKKPMCGFDLIKTILHQFHCFLSQGTVYPLLYSLERKGILKVENSVKAKIYSLSEHGEKIRRSKVDEFKKAQRHMLSLIE